jgi:hypothetical protein
LDIEQTSWTSQAGWRPAPPARLGDTAQLVLLFGSRAVLLAQEQIDAVRRAYPLAILLGCSTAGEIYDTQVLDDSLTVTAIHFESSQVRGAAIPIAQAADSFSAGLRLAEALDQPGLVHVFVLSEGLQINGSDLVDGLTQHLPTHVTVTGGLSADSSNFAETLVVWNGQPRSGTIAAVGLYGDHLRVGYGTLGGWDSFGPDRLITRSKGNILYELDGTSALSLYKRYLGQHAAGLPASGLLFPLSIAASPGEERLVRTLLSIDEAEQSITFAGDMPEGAYARLMRANFDRLIDGASCAAAASATMIGDIPAQLALLISCVGRKLVLGQRIEEEIESVRDVLGDRTVLAGFYSNGEISPLQATARCALHNQTMTITTFAEV